jgi:hypothetical protein
MAPRVNVTTQQITRAGLVPAMTAPTVDGDVVDCGPVALYVNNASGGVCTVTVQSPVTVDGLDVSELSVAVAAGTVRLIGPLPARTFGQPAGAADAGRAYVNYSVQASVTRAVVAL